MSELPASIREEAGQKEDPNHGEVISHGEKTEGKKKTSDKGEEEEKEETRMKEVDQIAELAVITKQLDSTLPFAGLATKGERIHGLVTEYEHTIWDVHNNEAMKVDNEMVKDWKESLNSLLLFAAIFAAVLTAFIIESKKLLEPDQTQILVGMVAVYFNNIGNLSSTSFSQPDFAPSHEAVVINCLLFASLGASLCAALVSVMALQWVTDYDAAITRGGSSPEDRAKRRQFRYAGVLNWKMGEIIAALPLLLYSSVVLFWVGVILWMKILNSTVGYVVAGGAAMAALLYAATTLLAAVFVSAPFRSPLSKGIYWLCHPTLTWVYNLFLKSIKYLKMLLPIFLLPPLILYLIFKQLLSLLPTFIKSAFRRWILPIVPMVKSMHRNIPWSTFSSHITHFIKRIVMSTTPRNKVSQREDEAADADPFLGEDALCWLAGQLPISVDSYRRLVLLTGAVLSHPHRGTFLPRFLKENGWDILDILGWYHLSKALDGASPEDDEGLKVLLQVGQDAQIVEQINAIENHKPGPSIIYRKRYGLNFERVQGGSIINAVLLLGPNSLKTMLQAYKDAVGHSNRVYIAGMLGKWGQRATPRDAMVAVVPSIIELLKDQYSDVRSSAATALLKLAEHVEFQDAIATTIPSIMQLLKDDDWDVRSSVPFALPKLAKHVEFRDAITTAIPSVIQLLKDGEGDVLWITSTALSELAEHVEFRDAISIAIPSIIQLLKYRYALVRSSAATALSKLAEHIEFRDAISTAIPSIIQLLKDRYSSVVSTAVTSLSELVEHVEFRNAIATAIPSIVHLLKDRYSDVRSAAATAIFKLAEHVEFQDAISTAIPSIIQLLKDDDLCARSSALIALPKLAEHVKIRDAIFTATPSMIQLLKDRDSGSRESATTALSELAEYVEFQDAITTAIPSIVQLLKGGEPLVIMTATTLLSKLAEHVQFRDAISTAIPSIIQLLKENNIFVSYAAITAISKLVEHVEFQVTIANAIPSIIQLLIDGHSDARLSAAKALPNLAEHVEFRVKIASAIPSIIQLLKDDDSRVRSSAADALPKLAEHGVEIRDAIASTIPSIILLLDDTSWAAQASAANALGKLAKYAEFQDAIFAAIPSVTPPLAVEGTSWEAGQARAAIVTAFGDFSQFFSK